jgi:hypothetical protein
VETKKQMKRENKSLHLNREVESDFKREESNGGQLLSNISPENGLY